MNLLQDYKLWNIETQCPHCGKGNYFSASNFNTNKLQPFCREKDYEVMCGLCEEVYYFRLPAINQDGGRVKTLKLAAESQPKLSGFRVHITLVDCEEYAVGISDNDSGALESFEPNDEYVVLPHGDNKHILGMYQRAYNDPTKVLIVHDDILNVRYESLQGQSTADESSLYFEAVTG